MAVTDGPPGPATSGQESDTVSYRRTATPGKAEVRTASAGEYGAAMTADDPDPRPPVQPVAGQPTAKLTIFEQMIKKTARILRQSRR